MHPPAVKNYKAKKPAYPCGNRKSNRLASFFNLLNNRCGYLSLLPLSSEVSELERLLTIIRPQGINSKAKSDCQDYCVPTRASSFFGSALPTEALLR